MNLLRTLGPVALLFALAALPSSEATAKVVGFATAAADPMDSGKLYYKAKAKQAGSCGANMYWKKGKCVDARDKK
jgi:hypothetical protein